MESNNLVLGRIPGSGSGLRKTYEESIFLDLSGSNESKLVSCSFDSRSKLYIDLDHNEVTILKSKTNLEDPSKYRELEILSILPYTYGEKTTYYMLEVIDKEILHRHLVEERMLLEEQIKERTL